jgi:hypothetical protein
MEVHNHMRVAKMPYLQWVDGIYRVRIVVPDDLKPHLPPPHTGKASLTKALGTGNKAEANRLSVPWIAEFQAAITKAAEIRRNPVLHDWIGRYACYHLGENPFAPEQRIITQNPALILTGNPYQARHLRVDYRQMDGQSQERQKERQEGSGRHGEGSQAVH